MVESWVGEEAFRAGVNAYIERFKYGNARAEDFWGTLTKHGKAGRPGDGRASSISRSPVHLCGAQAGPRALRRRRASARRRRLGGFRADGLGWTVPVLTRTPDGKTSCAVAAGSPASIPSKPVRWSSPNAGRSRRLRAATRRQCPHPGGESNRSRRPNGAHLLLTERALGTEGAATTSRVHMDGPPGSNTQQAQRRLETLVGSLEAGRREPDHPASRP